MAMALRCFRHLPSLLYRSSFTAIRGMPRAPAGCPALLLDGCRQCVHQMLLTRQLATKKAKGKGQSQARVNISAALVEDIINLEETNEDMQAVVEALKEDFSRNLSVRTSPGALDHIIVMTKDGKFPLNQLGQISQKSPQIIIVNMTNFPESTAAATKAIRESGMNLNPEVDGTIIRVPIPKVTREHRESLAKLAKQSTNKSKEALRKVRSKSINQVKKFKSKVSEDTIWLLEKQIQQMADSAVAEMDKLLAAKTKELLG
ncbi:ribosome-recycling factor, mitochondrial [Harpia harpyja]|uniref:ribosome-recycling factor, mitochondrial n=1 Tax=Harpia harpyja TaxID=202280 RepID=UPI0022B177E6|nr:ribosome-recycling factor, mitochondrial [Harpia harpyja]XP_052670639.1 ribosome-recycling factor, mitochondrial [Harpia harpyja]XP_052670640.1 ribosome-recycling factor, mitochondrial [Harpia harpyja]